LSRPSRLIATILGCGASYGVPRIGNDWGACDPNEPRNRRTRCALLLERFGDGERPTTVLIDTGPEIRQQLLSAGVRHIDGVLYTHAHADHIHGIDDLRAFWLTTKRLVDVYADRETTRRLLDAFGYCFHMVAGSNYPPILKHHAISAGTAVNITGPGGPLSLVPFRQIHGEIESLGFRVGGLGYSSDISGLPKESADLLQGLAVWVLDALRQQPHGSHFGVAQALDWIERLKVPRGILTHMHVDLDYQTLRRELPAHVEPAYDGMRIELPAE
jgi:phosphoribosyl 1,2-cyclic phosphate phosphodiesterase